MFKQQYRISIKPIDSEKELLQVIKVLNMGRAISKPIIQIGLVSIPIRLETLQRSHDIHFKQICPNCKESPIRQKWFCSRCETEFLSSAGFLKGWEDKANNTLKVFSKEQISVLNADTKIDIFAVIPSGNIPFYFVEKTYSVSAEKKFEELFNLFYSVLNEYGYCVIGKYALRGKQHIIAIIPYQERLFMSILYYPDEVNLPLQIAKTQENIKENAELLAKILQKFEKDTLNSLDIKDERTEAVIQLLEGGTPLDIPIPKPSNNIQELLKKSLEG